MNNEVFLKAYVQAALWSTIDEDSDTERFLDRQYSMDDLEPEMLEHVTKDCNDFIAKNEALLEEYLDGFGFDEAQAGHDFWLTRNHHGAGFWDKTTSDNPLDAVCQKLTEASQQFREEDWYAYQGKITCDYATRPDLKTSQAELPEKEASAERPDLGM